VLGVCGRRGAERRAVKLPFVLFHAATLFRDSVPRVGSGIGMLAFTEAYAEWVREENQEGLAQLLRSAMSRLWRAVTELG
jgi:hypothetical protein